MAYKTLPPFDLDCWHIDDVDFASFCVEKCEGSARAGVNTEYFHKWTLNVVELEIKFITANWTRKDNTGMSGNGVSLDAKQLEALNKVIANAKPTDTMEFLTPYDLHRRWSKAISLKTLANWRSLNIGPPYSKIGGRVLYRVGDLVYWENEHRYRTK